MAYNYLTEIDYSANTDTFYEGIVTAEANFLLLDNEIYAARGSAASLDARLDVALNEDGSAKAAAGIVANWVTGSTPTYIGTTSFSVVGDQTAIYTAGRRLACALGGTTVYNDVVSSAYTTVTTVTVTTANLTADLSAVSYGVISTGSTGSVPIHDHVDNNAGGVIVAFPATTVMLFGQSAAPTGWTKKTDWQDQSMLVYTTGNIAQGGAVDAKAAHQHAAFTLAIAEMPAHTHPLKRSTGLAGSGVWGYTNQEDGGADVTSSTGGGGSHQHAANSAPYYASCIAATKD